VIVVLKTTEYIPAPMVFGAAVLGWLWLWAGHLMGDEHMIVRLLLILRITTACFAQRANMVGVAINLVQHALFFVYPPKTWVVPVYGVGGGDLTYGRAKKTA